MPTVRAYGQRQVTTAPIPGVRKRAAETPISEGAGFEQAKAQKADAIAQLGGTVARAGIEEYSQILQEERQKADDTALLEAETTLGKWEHSRLYNPDTGALTKQGKDAMGLPEQVGQDFDKVASDLSAGLSTDRQRAEFARVKANHAVNLDSTIQRHVFQESQKYEATELDGFVTNGVNTAIHSALDPRRVAQELNTVTAKIELHGPRVGMSPETVKTAVAAARSEVHVGVINNLLANSQHRQAAIYFEEVKDQIAGDKLATVTKAVNIGSVNGEAQKASDAIIRAGGSLTEQREKAKAIDDPDVRDQTLQYIEHEDAIRKREAQGKDEDLMVTAGNLIDKGGIRAVPPGLLAQLTPTQKETLEKYAKRNIVGGTGDSDKVRYFDLKTMALDEPQKFKDVNLRNDLAKLTKTELKELLELQDHIRKGDTPRADAALDGFRTNQQIVDDTLDLAHVARTGAKAQTELVARFRRTLDDQVGSWQRLTGKKAGNDDVQRLADDLLARGVAVPNSWFQQLIGNPLTGKRLLDVTVADIPPAIKTHIVDLLQKNRIQVNDQTILQSYIDGQLKAGTAK
jgi:hypothetical protein